MSRRTRSYVEPSWISEAMEGRNGADPAPPTADPAPRQADPPRTGGLFGPAPDEREGRAT